MADKFAPPPPEVIQQYKKSKFLPPPQEVVQQYQGKPKFAPPPPDVLEQYKKEHPDVSQTETAIRSGLQGLTMGTADEIEGALVALTSDKTYREAQREAQAKLEAGEKKFPKTALAAGIVGSLPLALVPGLGVAKGARIATQAAAAAGLGAVEAAGRSKAEITNLDTDELQKFGTDILIGGVFGGVLGGAIGAIGKKFQKATERLRNDITKNQASIVQGAEAILEDQGDRTIADLLQEGSEKELRKFAKTLTSKPVPEDPAKVIEVIEDFMKREGDAFTEKKFQDYRFVNAARDYIKKEAIFLSPENSASVSRIGSFISDAQFVYDKIDNKWGTTLQPTLNELSQGYNLYTHEIASLGKEIKPLRQALRKSTLSSEDIFNHLNYNSPIKPQTTADKEAIELTKKIFADLKDRANDLGLPIQQLQKDGILSKNYIMNKTVEPAVFKSRLNKRFKELADNGLENMTLAEIKEIPAGEELLAGLKLISTKKIKNGADLARKYHFMLDNETLAKRIGTNADASFKRKGEIPDFLLEKDVLTLLNKWGANTFRHAYLREGMADLSKNAQILKTLDPSAAKYIENHLKDITGVPRSFLPKVTQQAVDAFRTSMLTKADQTSSKVLAGAYKAAADAPELTRFMMNQIYPNFLGLNPKATVRNLIQPYALTAADLIANDPKAAARASKYAFKGSLNAAANYGKLVKELEKKGWRPAAFTGEARDSLEKSILSSTPFRMTKEMLDNVTNKTMYFYEMSDTMNRATTLAMAKDITKDFLTKDQTAVSMVKKLPRGYQIKIARALEDGNEEVIHDLIADSLLSRTQFNYNKIAMSELGRTLGPMFSVFSKWPTSVAGDIITKMKNDGKLKGATKSLIKYGGPFALLTLADQVMFEQGKPATPREKKLTGAGGFASWAPGTSIIPVVTGDIAAPPAIQTGTDFFKALSSNKPGELERWMKDTAQAYMPGAVFWRVMEKDIPAIVQNKEKK